MCQRKFYPYPQCGGTPRIPSRSRRCWPDSRLRRIVSLIDERDVIDLPVMLRLLAQASIALQAGKMLKCLGLWQQGVRVDPQRQTGIDPPPED